MATFKVLSEFEGDGGELEFICEKCGKDATVPTRGYCRVEAIIGMAYVWDPVTPPPAGFLPSEVECRYCHNVYQMGDFDVR